MHVYDHLAAGAQPGVKNKTPKAFLFFLAVFLVTALLFVTVCDAAENTPESLPGALQAAIDNKDWDAARQFLDVSALVNAFVNDSLEDITKAAAEGDIRLSGPLAFALASLNSGNEATKKAGVTLLTAEISKFLAYGVRSGAFAGAMLPKEELKDMDGGLFLQYGRISSKRKEFGPGSLISRNGSTAVVKTSLKDYYNGATYPLRLELQEADGRWKAIKILNAGELARQFF